MDTSAPVEGRCALEPSRRYLPLDGLRGAATLVVIIAHCSRLRPGGAPLDRLVQYLLDHAWLALEFFFVLSGFLIAGLLRNGRGVPGALRDYFVARGLRILPPYFLLLTILFLLPAPFNPMREYGYPPNWDVQKWFWAHGSNIFFVRESIYAAPPGVGHLWSLAVEEQFYLVWPLVVLLLEDRGLLRLCCGVIVLCPLLRVEMRLGDWPTLAPYLLTPARLDSFAAGTALLVLLRTGGDDQTLHRVRRATLAIALAVIAACFVVHQRFYMTDLLTSTIGISGAIALMSCLVAWGVQVAPHSVLARMATWRPLLVIAKRSYPLYLVHFPITFWVSQRLGSAEWPRVHGSQLPYLVLFTTLVLVLSWMCAGVMAAMAERPALALRKRLLHGAR